MAHVTNQKRLTTKQRDELAMIARSLRNRGEYGFLPTVGRPATRREIVRTAWANLAIEEPDLTLAEAQRILGEDGAEAP